MTGPAVRTWGVALGSRLAILGVGLLLGAALLILDAYAPANRRIIKIAGIDPICYFATAHSLLFDRDFDLSNQYAALKQPAFGEIRLRPETGLPGSPYPIGYSLLEIPFLAAGTVVDRLAGRPADGYSRGALTAYFIGHIVFVTVGLLCVHDVLIILTAELFPTAPGRKRKWISLIVTLALLPATTLGVYTFSPMSHAAGFMSVALFFRAWVRTRGSDSVRSQLLLGILGGLAVVCRWQNLLLLVAPVLAALLARKSHRQERFRPARWIRALGIYAVAAFVMLLPQFAEWKAIYGSYLLNPHGTVLQFPPPFIPQVLFSTRHGWFIWTPACLLCVAGLLWGCFERTEIFLPWTIVLAGEVAVIGSIQAPSFGWWGSFSSRFMTCTLAISALGLFYLLMRASSSWRTALWGTLVLASAYTVIFAVQWRLDLIPTDDNLTFSELVSDKFALRRAYERRSLAKRCSAMLEQGNSLACARILEDGIRRLGADRFLLEALVRAEEVSGDRQSQAEAKARLNAFLAKRLW